jgi:coenzyme F420-0:L-glutamate ligase
MNIFGVFSSVISSGDIVIDVFLKHIQKPLREKSIIIITSKVVSVAEGSLLPCRSEKELEVLVFEEADKVFGKSKEHNFWITKKNGFILPNAGIDKSNAKPGYVILLPKNSKEFAEKFREKIQEKMNLTNIGVIVCDSRILPFRRGISGVSLACAGFSSVSDERGKKDIFGEELRVSEISVADNLASVAQIFFGQSGEQVPFVVAEDAPVSFTDEQQDSFDSCVSEREDIFTSVFHTCKKNKAVNFDKEC